MIRLPYRLFMLVLVAGLFGCGLFTGSALAAGCDQYASPSGSDSSGNGSLGSPYQTLAQLDASLSPGQTGCLRAGTYGSVSTVHWLGNSGSASGDITITTYPGETATVSGLVELEGSYTTLTGLTIDGSNNAYSVQRSGTTCPYPVSNGMEIDGQNDTLQDSSFYQSVAALRGNGIGIGWNAAASNTILRYNRLYDVGGCDDYDHIVYLDSGNNVQIYDNWMWSDAHGWGVQVYPAASNARIYSNVIDGAGSGTVFASTGGGNQFYDNVVMNSVGISNPDISWSAPGYLLSCLGGTGDSVTNNDSFNNPGGVGPSCRGVSISGNITSDPDLVNPAAHDYAPAAGSPLASWGLWNGNPGGSTATTPPLNPPTVANSSPPAARADAAGNRGHQTRPAQPTVTGVAQSSRVWHEGIKAAAASGERRPRLGAVVTFKLSDRAQVDFAFTRKLSGAQCTSQARGNRHRHTCKRAVVVPVICSFAAHSGANKLFFPGSMLRSRNLKLGRYTLLITATNAAGERMSPASLTLTILR